MGITPSAFSPPQQEGANREHAVQEPLSHLPGSHPQLRTLRQPDYQRESFLSSDQLRVSVQQSDVQGRWRSGAGELPHCGQHWGSVVLRGPRLLLLSGPGPLPEVPQQSLVIRGLCHSPSHLSRLSRGSRPSPPCRPCGSCRPCCPSGASPSPGPSHLPSPPASPCGPLLCGGCWRSGTNHPGDIRSQWRI